MTIEDMLASRYDGLTRQYYDALARVCELSLVAGRGGVLVTWVEGGFQLQVVDEDTVPWGNVHVDQGYGASYALSIDHEGDDGLPVMRT